MTVTIAALVILGLLALYLGAGSWVFTGLMLVGATAMWLVLDFSPARIGSIATKVISSSAISWELAAIPIFMWMGDIIFRTDISNRLFRGLAPLVSRIPGGLLHTNVFGCTVFAAISGSSTATTATVGKITIPELQGRGYDMRLAARIAGRCRLFRPAHPPLDRDDRLRRAGRGLDRQAFRGRAGSGPDDGRPLCRLHRACLARGPVARAPLRGRHEPSRPRPRRGRPAADRCC